MYYVRDRVLCPCQPSPGLSSWTSVPVLRDTDLESWMDRSVREDETHVPQTGELGQDLGPAGVRVTQTVTPDLATQPEIQFPFLFHSQFLPSWLPLPDFSVGQSAQKFSRFLLLDFSITGADGP